MDSFSEVFNLVKERCKTMMSDTAYTCWIKPIQPLELDEDTVYLYVPNSFQKSLLERQYDGKCAAAAFGLTQRDLGNGPQWSDRQCHSAAQ